MNDQTRMSVTETMAQRFGMTANNFEQVLRATVLPKECTREQFAAFLLIARKYNLDPIAREIYAFPRPGGGIQPLVSIDGWMEIINSHPQMDGMEFEEILAPEGDLLGIKCRIHRKDRKHPTEVIEYMTECRRNTATWNQWPIRMLRHKAAIQAARYAFGFSGILDPDDFERWTGPDKQPERPARHGRKEMPRQFKAWEPTGDPEVWEEPPVAEEPVNAKKPDYAGMPPSSTPPGPNDPQSGAEAYELGRQARTKDASRLQWPGLWRDQHMIDAWLAGWDEEDKELRSP